MADRAAPATPRSALELDAAAMTELVEAVLQRLHDRNAVDHPVDSSALADAAFLRRMIEGVPERGESLATVLDTLFDDCAGRSLDPTSPGFMGYIPGGGIFHAAVAGLIADALNSYVGVSAVAGGFMQIESNVIRWFLEFMGLPAGGGGFLTSGGSLANWSAVVTARECRLGENFGNGVIYASDQAHLCVQKAARLAGFARDRVRVIPADAQFRLPLAALAAAVTADRARGLDPFLIVANAGTTNTGAVDPLPELAAFAAGENMWLHVDAAYGGFFRLTARGQQMLKGIEQADSIVLDPHKTLFLPYGTGALLVRDARRLHQAHSATADYLPPLGDPELVTDFSDVSPELTRPFRALKVWLPMKLHGVGAFRETLDEKLDLVRYLHDCLAAMPAVEILAAPQLSVLAFALRHDGGDPGETNRRTRDVMTAINARQRVMLTGTMLGNRFAIRVAIVSYRTHRDRVDLLLEDLTAALAASAR
ncbi:MAG: aminotransferase class I/II-fold pyridoxal phosphate-dependent enzyme [Pseudomonadales bacterium]|nr:aminotransferase class I/II-fold pyridoxal phosphate-dependent enzyme [Pseudomonadales bacterium]